MSAYLHIGFVAKATTNLPNGISSKELLEEIEDYYPNDTYDCIESGSELVLTLKPEVLQAELLPFVRQVYEDFHGDTERGWLKTALEFIQKSAGSLDWLEKRKKRICMTFHRLTMACPMILRMRERGFGFIPPLSLLVLRENS
jgi:hypothetical protein